MRLAWIVVVVIAACGPDAREITPDAPAAPDAAPPCSPFDPFLQSIAVSGMTPAGPLDAFHFAHGSIGCGGTFIIELTQTTTIAGCPGAVALFFDVDAPYLGGPVFAGSLDVNASTGMVQTRVALEAARIDPWTVPLPRLIGRFHTDQPGWSFDFDLDVVAQYGDPICDF